MRKVAQTVLGSRVRVGILSSLLTVFGCGGPMPEHSDTQTDPSQAASLGAPADFTPGSRVHKMPLIDPNTPRVINTSGTPHLDYYGGRVISNVQVVQVLYGSGTYVSQVSSTGTPSMATFYQQVTNSAYMDWLSEYNTNITAVGGQTGTQQTIGRGSFLRQVQITPSSSNNGSTISDSQIQAEISAQITSGVLPAPTTDAAGNVNTIYMVNFPKGKVITQGGSNSCQAGGFCAYHGTFTKGSQHLYYGVLPDMSSGSGCDTGCGSSTTFNNQTSVASHELIEAVTDAEVGLATVAGPPLAWYDQNNSGEGEIGDICNAQQGTIAGTDGQSYTVQKEFDNASSSCIVSKTTQSNDFSLSASPTSLSVAAGGSGSVTVSTAVTSGSAQTVSLSVTGTPSGATATFSPTSVTAGSSSTLSINAGTAAAGTYTLTVKGTATSGSHTATVTLTIGSGGGNVLSNGVPVTGLSGATGAQLNFTMSVPAGATNLKFVISGGTGDADLYVKFGSAPTLSSYDCRPYISGNSETCTFAAPSTGTYYVMLNGYAAFSGVTLTGSYTAGGGGGSGITNGTFETGSLSGWTASGAHTGVSTTAHAGSYSALLGNTSATNGDSTITQTFTAPSGTTTLSFYYAVSCPDTVTYDWFTATLKDNTTGTTTTVVSKTCPSYAWTNKTAAVTAGHSYTLTLTSHDDNYSSDPTYSLVDDVVLQ